MKFLASSLLVGATVAAAASPPQQVLQQHLPQKVVDALKKPWNNAKESYESLSDDVRAAWDEVAMLFPDEMSKPLFPAPKKTYRKPDSHWDHVVKGADIQGMWVENAEGEKERKIDGKLETYNMRVKKVDPSKLGVDPDVKQFSGYLDDEENDKHLFYCTYQAPYDDSKRHTDMN